MRVAHGPGSVAGTIAVVATLALAARRAHAQAPAAEDSAAFRRSVTVMAEGGYTEHRVDAGLGLERASGAGFGAAAGAALTPWLELGLRGSSGRLEARTTLATDRTVRDLELAASVLPLEWLAIQLGGSARTWSSDVGEQRWVALRTGAEARLDFVGGAVRGIIGLALLPQVSVSGLSEGPSVALATATGVRLRGRRLEGALLYTMERFDFPANAGRRRLEQVSALRLQGGVRLGR